MAYFYGLSPADVINYRNALKGTHKFDMSKLENSNLIRLHKVNNGIFSDANNSLYFKFDGANSAWGRVDNSSNAIANGIFRNNSQNKGKWAFVTFELVLATRMDVHNAVLMGREVPSRGGELTHPMGRLVNSYIANSFAENVRLSTPNGTDGLLVWEYTPRDASGAGYFSYDFIRNLSNEDLSGTGGRVVDISMARNRETGYIPAPPSQNRIAILPKGYHPEKVLHISLENYFVIERTENQNDKFIGGPSGNHSIFFGDAKKMEDIIEAANNGTINDLHIPSSNMKDGDTIERDTSFRNTGSWEGASLDLAPAPGKHFASTINAIRATESSAHGASAEGVRASVREAVLTKGVARGTILVDSRGNVSEAEAIWAGLKPAR
jgi:hypothetical protein